MRTTFKVSFYLRSNYENKEGKSPVMLRVFLNGEMANFGSTKIFVDKSLWNNTTSRLKGRTAEALSANAALDSISTMLTNIYHKFEDDESLSLDKIRSFFIGKDREYTTFLPVFDKFNEDVRQRVGHTISKDSLQKYSVLRRHIDVSKLTPDNIVTLDDKQWIMTKRQKTSVETNVLLLDIPKNIIAKYSHKTYRDGKLFPILTNQKRFIRYLE